ncbi:fibronectin type III domain-containing protein, partial [Ruminococcus bicirculans (ex Wegman et al. 2014)]|uniref:fibronectin type III domain-containing protein n=2 Tax=Oscillospiraceae TaxID=216572 RepID=UPI003FD84343
ASKYELYIKGGKYKSWKKYKTVKNTNCTVTGLQRTTSYQFRVKAVNGSAASAYSKTQTIKTARMDFNKAGWEAMCRIVYHEVGKMSGSEWDKPIVYVADCVANQYVAAKYTKNAMWRSYYARYNNVQDIIYRSGGFMSSAQLSRDGANYSNVSRRVKQAVFGAVYGKTHLNGIANDYNVYFWCNRSYKTNSSKIAYSFKIPWGYFNVWRTYWG